MAKIGLNKAHYIFQFQCIRYNTGLQNTLSLDLELLKQTLRKLVHAIFGECLSHKN